MLTKIDDELNDLHDGDVALPPNANSARGLEVVPVHDDVNHEVQGDRDPGDRGVANELGVAQQGCRTMMVGVKKGFRS